MVLTDRERAEALMELTMERAARDRLLDTPLLQCDCPDCDPEKQRQERLRRLEFSAAEIKRIERSLGLR